MKPFRLRSLSIAALALLAFATCARAADDALVAPAVRDEPARQVVLDIALIALPETNVAAVARKNRKAAPGNDEILALWQDGQGRLIETRRLVTIEGSEVNSAAGDEIIYPTEFEATQPSFGFKGDPYFFNPVTPGSFETQQTGLRISASEISDSDAAHPNIKLKVEYRVFQQWEEIISRAESKANPKGVLALMQPRFYVQSIDTIFVTQDGATTVLGGFTGPDPAERLFLLVTVERKLPEPAPAKEGAKRERRGDRP